MLPLIKLNAKMRRITSVDHDSNYTFFLDPLKPQIAYIMRRSCNGMELLSVSWLQLCITGPLL